MKKYFLLMVFFWLIGGCGTGTEEDIPHPCTTDTECAENEICKSEKCVSQCWSDTDCEENEKCLEGICIFKPECYEYEDCTQEPDKGIVCRDYRCVSYAEEDDSCFMQTCNDNYNNECVECGEFTTCGERLLDSQLQPVCVDACIQAEELRVEVWDETCNEIVNVMQVACNICICWLDNHQVPAPGNEGCELPHPLVCHETRSTEFKSKIEELGTDAYKEYLKQLLEDTCIY